MDDASKKYIIADIINGLYIDTLEGTEKIYTNIDFFVEDLARPEPFGNGAAIAIEYTEKNVAAIKAAGYGF